MKRKIKTPAKKPETTTAGRVATTYSVYDFAREKLTVITPEIANPLLKELIEVYNNFGKNIT